MYSNELSTLGTFSALPVKIFTGNHTFYSSEQNVDYWLTTQLFHIALVAVLHARLMVDKAL